MSNRIIRIDSSSSLVGFRVNDLSLSSKLIHDLSFDLTFKVTSSLSGSSISGKANLKVLSLVPKVNTYSYNVSLNLGP